MKPIKLTVAAAELALAAAPPVVATIEPIRLDFSSPGWELAGEGLEPRSGVRVGGTG